METETWGFRLTRAAAGGGDSHVQRAYELIKTASPERTINNEKAGRSKPMRGWRSRYTIPARAHPPSSPGRLAASGWLGGSLEFPYDPPAWSLDRRDYPMTELLDVDADGWIVLGEAPELGFELNEERLAHTHV